MNDEVNKLDLRKAPWGFEREIHDGGPLKPCFTDEEKDELERIVKPVQDWLRKCGDPHMDVIVRTHYAEVVGGLLGFTSP